MDDNNLFVIQNFDDSGAQQILVNSYEWGVGVVLQSITSDRIDHSIGIIANSNFTEALRETISYGEEVEWEQDGKSYHLGRTDDDGKYHWVAEDICVPEWKFLMVLEKTDLEIIVKTIVEAYFG